jgi:DNA-binding response OmpR family regulator
MPPDRAFSLDGRRILLVEDETFVTMLLEDMLDELGCILAGAAASFPDGLRIAQTVEADAAILDVNLAGQEIFPIAERLVVRGVPVIFATGYDQEALPQRWRTAPVIRKPFSIEQVRAALGTVLSTP